MIASPSGDGRPLFVVDDDPMVCELVGSVGTGLGFDVRIAHHAGDFIQDFDDALAATIVLDLAMPGTDGIQIIRELARRECRAAIVLMSGFDVGVLRSAEHIARAHGLHVAATLRKPFPIDELRSALERGSNRERDAGTRPAAMPDAHALGAAIALGEITVDYQPQVSLATGSVVGFEALARWRRLGLTEVAPRYFLPLAEDSGLIDALTERVLSQAVADCAAWRAGGVDAHVSVNISPRSLNRLDWPERVMGTLAEHDLAPDHVVVEITEGHLMSKPMMVLDVLSRLRMNGMGLSIDDFGTGYSSLSLLNTAPFTELKVDREFISEAASHEATNAIAETVLSLGHKLGMTVVAEGVDTDDVWHNVRAMGYDLAQGYYVSPALGRAELPAWLDDWAGRARSLTPQAPGV